LIIVQSDIGGCLDFGNWTLGIAVQCNIDRKGRALRAVSAAVLLLLAGLGFWQDWPLWASVALTAAGLFCGFEALCGWCALRALGFKTRC
jgi:hypothetical protein